ncbi:chloroplast import apparatus 2-like protein [Tanacetum coccineum]
MSSCLSSRAYGFDLENILKSSSSTTTLSRASHSSSPSSTISESSNSVLAVFTRKPRTPRKRPKQTYNEAAALLSTACPNIFSITKKCNKVSKLPKKKTFFFNETPELLLPLPVSEKPVKAKSSGAIDHGSLNCVSNSSSVEISEEYQDFDTESILDEEIEEGIDGIIGKCNSNSIVESDGISNEKHCFSLDSDFKYNYNYNTCYGYPLGLGLGGNLEFNFGFGLRNGVRALKNVDDGNWWRFPAVNVMNVSQSPPALMKSKKVPVVKKKKVEDLMKLEPELGNLAFKDESLSLDKSPRLLLKLNYNEVLNAWADKGSPLPEELSGSESPGGDIHTRLAQIDLFSENGGVREASVIRYKEKRRTRLFSKKIRYQVRKVNADCRPRSKGRFVRRPDSPSCDET